jgi:hypothetical protein
MKRPELPTLTRSLVSDDSNTTVPLSGTFLPGYGPPDIRKSPDASTVLASGPVAGRRTRPRASARTRRTAREGQDDHGRQIQRFHTHETHYRPSPFPGRGHKGGQKARQSSHLAAALRARRPHGTGAVGSTRGRR